MPSENGQPDYYKLQRVWRRQRLNMVVRYLLLVCACAIAATASAKPCKVHIDGVDLKLYADYDAKFCRQLTSKAAMAWTFQEINNVKSIKVEMHAKTTGWILWGINNDDAVEGADVAIAWLKGSSISIIVGLINSYIYLSNLTMCISLQTNVVFVVVFFLLWVNRIYLK